MKLMIDEEFKQLIPPLSGEEFRQLKENILSDGCREPLVVWENTIVDGHNRYNICTESNISFKTEKKHFPNKEAVIVWMLKNQLGRRNLSDFQRNEVALKYQEVIARQMKEKMKLSEGRGKKRVDQMIIPFSEPTNQRKELAKIAGTSGGSIYRSKKILEKGTTEQIERARKGGKGNSVTAIFDEIKAKESGNEETKTCKTCGKALHVSNFYNGKKECKSCQNKKKPLRDWKGSEYKIAPEYKDLTEEDIIGDLYNVDAVVEQTIEDVLESFQVNFETYLRTLEGILEHGLEVIKEKENNKKIMATLTEAVIAMQNMKGKYSYEKL